MIEIWKMNIFYESYAVNTILKIILTFLHFYHEWGGIGFTRKMIFEIFIKSVRFDLPWERKKTSFHKSVYL